MTADNITERRTTGKRSNATERRLLFKAGGLLLLGLAASRFPTQSQPISDIPLRPATPEPDLQELKVRDVLERGSDKISKEVSNMIDFSKLNPPTNETGEVWEKDLQALRITRFSGDDTFQPSHIANSLVDPNTGLVFTNVCGTTADGMGCFVIYASTEELDLPHGGS